MFFHPWHRTRGVGTGSWHQRTYQDRRTTQHVPQVIGLKWSNIWKLDNIHPGKVAIICTLLYSVYNNPVIGKVIGETLFQK
jgi:hypothetical protein